MVRVLFDSNILIDYLNGVDEARIAVSQHRSMAISLLSWIEVLSGAKSEHEHKQARRFLTRFKRIEVDRVISAAALQVRRNRRIKVPDAIIHATAIVEKRILITRDARDFRSGIGVIIPYTL